MESTKATVEREGMRVCRNGHVVSDGLADSPSMGLGRCDRCGASTLTCCPTCGHALVGAEPVPGLSVIGRLQPPAFCPRCGGCFPWTHSEPAVVTLSAVSSLESMLRAVPRVIRQMRNRHGDRRAWRVADIHDLEDLLRCLLPLHFEHVWPESRTPSYAATVRTDFRLGPTGNEPELIVTAKWVESAHDETALPARIHEDLDYYQSRFTAGTVIALVYDPQFRLTDPATLAAALSSNSGGWQCRCITAR